MTIKVEFGFSDTGSLDIQFNDISADVISVSVNRGKDPQQDTFNAASCSVQLNNETRNYDPDYPASPYQGQIVPTGSLRVYSNDQIVFTGFITDWNFSYSPNGESIAEIVASDVFVNLNNQVLTGYEPSEQLSSARIISVLARPETGGTAVWTDLTRKISTGVATMGAYTVNDGTNVLSYLQEVEKAEPGRLFIDKQGRLIFRSRNNDLDNPSYTYSRTNLSSNPSFENNTRNWNPVTGTITRSTAIAAVGSASAILSAGGVVDHFFPSTFGSDYTAQVAAIVTSGTSSVQICGLTSFDGTTYTETDLASFVVEDYYWNTVYTTFNAISGFSGIRVKQSPSSASIYIDQVLIEETPVLDAYFDGSNQPTYNYDNPDAADYQPERAFESYDPEWVL